MTTPTTPVARPVLELDAIAKTFPGHGRRQRIVALDDVSLSVDGGESVGLVGASGAGKSTIARIVAGLERADRGTIRVGGTDTSALGRAGTKRLRRDLHLIFQDPYASLCPMMRVGDIVGEPLVIHGQRRTDRADAVADALGRVHLDPGHFVRRRPHELSGGERQRVALARAIIVGPRLIVADEPTAMLDASLRAGLLDLLRELRVADGVSFLYITHDLAVARSFCDRIAVMAGGRIVEQGPTAAVLGTPTHPATERLVAAAAELALNFTAAGPSAARGTAP